MIIAFAEGVANKSWLIPTSEQDFEDAINNMVHNLCWYYGCIPEKIFMTRGGLAFDPKLYLGLSVYGV